MVWLPAGYDGSCSGNASNHSAPLTLMCFLVQYFGKSNDEILDKIHPKQDVNQTDYDFIVVGAGSAGCVVASRLSEVSDWKVLLLENGDEEPNAAQIPGLFSYMYNSNIDYAYRTNDTKKETYNRGKVMGGSSGINGMVYARGSKADYDDWARSGNAGWSWKNVLPYFKKSENARDPNLLANYSSYHGVGGYLNVERYPVENEHVPTFINAFKEAGLKENDYNMGDQIGVSRMQFTNIHGSRLSANGAFIRPFRGRRPNLIVKPNTRVTKIIIDEKTKRAIGVEYEINSEHGTIKNQVFSKKEVIVSAGFIESPKLLMLSGVGPKKDLEQLNITVMQDLPVGQNLRDHFRVPLVITSNSTILKTSDEKIKSNLFQWLTTHEGPLSARGSITIEVFYQSKYENKLGAADVQYEFGGGAIGEPLSKLTIWTILVAPQTRGYIKLNKADPIRTQPDIVLNPLSNTHDLEVLVEGLKFALQVVNTSTIKSLGLKPSTVPVEGCEHFDIESDDYLRCFIKKNVGHNSHGAGTCKMGPRYDHTSVVDSQLRVHGIRGLRVIDASIMPKVIRANTHAPTVMIGEKGSDMIKKYWLVSN